MTFTFCRNTKAEAQFGNAHENTHNILLEECHPLWPDFRSLRRSPCGTDCMRDAMSNPGGWGREVLKCSNRIELFVLWVIYRDRVDHTYHDFGVLRLKCSLHLWSAIMTLFTAYVSP